MKRFTPLLILSLVLAAVCSSPPASATPICGGCSISSFTDATGTPVGTFEASLASSISTGSLSGFLDSAVYMISPTEGQFWYEVFNNASSTDNVSRFSINGLLPSLYTINVFTRTDLGAGTVAPTSADLTNNGVFGVNFGNVPSTKVQPGQSSYIVVVDVSNPNGVNFTTVPAAVIDGIAANVTAFGPTVPESTSFLYVGLGLLGVALFGIKLRGRLSAA